MNIVPLVAVSTGTRDPDLPRNGSDVTIAASSLGVDAFQREVRLLGVIEPPEVPAVRVVAELTPGTEGAMVKVVAAVAGATVFVRIVESRRLVAVFTGDRGVETE
jgi:hypothetical protein